MNKINHFSGSQDLAEFISALCPIDAHIHVSIVGVWACGDVESFSGQFMSDVTTHLTIVRAISYNGVTYWTRESWTHDNGYHVQFSTLTKAEFLQAIRL